MSQVHRDRLVVLERKREVGHLERVNARLGRAVNAEQSEP